MAFDWSQYLSVATSLRKLGTESYFRSAVSRVYYYAFNIAFQYLKDTRNYKKHTITDTFGTRKASKHENTSMSLEALGHPSEANALKNLRQLRNECDYDSETLDLNGKLDDAFDDAAHVIDLVNSLRQGKRP